MEFSEIALRTEVLWTSAFEPIEAFVYAI